MEEEGKDVELRSEEVQEVMGQIPAWILRWGVTILFIVVLCLLIGSCFFKYPDVIVAEMTLTSRNPVAQIVARASGKMSALYVKDGEDVMIGTPLAVLENPAITGDILSLKTEILKNIGHPDSLMNSLLGKQELMLGEVQAGYTNLLNVLHEYRNYRELNYYPQKISSVQRQIAKYHVYYQGQKRQQQVMEAQYQIACQQYKRDSLLFNRQILSPSEHEMARATFLQSRYSLEGTNASLENLKIQIGQMDENLLDLQLEQMEKESSLQQNLRSVTEQLLNAINSWELNFCLTAPIKGKVTFTTFWNANQYVSSGETVFTIVPEGENLLIGKALLPVTRSGKVKVGQRVIIRFSNYPDQEFGIVNGCVSTISLVPAKDFYMVEIAFPEGLTTNYKISLPVSQEMKASAEIVTEDLRLIERFFQPLKKILKEGF